MTDAFYLVLLGYLRCRASSLWYKHQADEAGLTTVEWVILIGIVAAMATAVGKIIYDKVTAKANNIPGL